MHACAKRSGVSSFSLLKPREHMETQTQELASILRERLAIIRDEASRKNVEAHMERLRLISEKLDAIVATLPRPVDPQLAHFLERRSYDKALARLEGRLDDPV